MTTWEPLTPLVAVALAVTRLAGHKSQSFQAAAHLFVGFLIGWAVWGPDWRCPAAVVAVLSVAEVFAFVRDRVRKK